MTYFIRAGPSGRLFFQKSSIFVIVFETHELNNTQFNRYLYGGKELQTGTVGGTMLGLYDFHARFYNPVHGRWFNVDPALQFTSPYVYAGNSPMMYVDENGEFAFIPILLAVAKAAAWGAGISAATYTASIAMSPGGFDNWSWSGFGKSVGIGALTGAATFGVGEAFGATGSLLNEAGRGLAHGAVQGGGSVLGGGDFWSGFASGTLGSYAGHGADALGITKSAAGTLAYSSVAGGVGSWATGGDFLQGAANGLMVGGLNQLKHRIDWTKANQRDKIKQFLEAYKDAVVNKRDYFDLREAFENFPIYGAGGAYMSYLEINGENMPVYMNLATWDDMRIGTGFQIQSPRSTYGAINGIPKTGTWSSYGFYRYVNPPVARPLPMATIQVPIQHNNTFYQFLMK